MTSCPAGRLVETQDADPPDKVDTARAVAPFRKVTDPDGAEPRPVSFAVMVNDVPYGIVTADKVTLMVGVALLTTCT